MGCGGLADYAPRRSLLLNNQLSGYPGMTIVLRILLLAGLVVVAIYLFRRLAPRLAADPRMRQVFSGLGLRLLLLFLLRRGLPLLARTFRMLRFFR